MRKVKQKNRTNADLIIGDSAYNKVEIDLIKDSPSKKTVTFDGLVQGKKSQTPIPEVPFAFDAEK